MAQKVTKDTLTSINQDWAGNGKNIDIKNGDQIIRTVDNPFNATSDNLPFSGLDIQKWIKDNTIAAYGFYDLASDGYYSLCGFASKEDKATFDKDNNKLELIKVQAKLMIRESTTLMTAVNVFIQEEEKPIIVAKDNALDIHVRITSVETNSVTLEKRDTLEQVNVIISYRVAGSGSTWTDIQEINNVDTQSYTATSYALTVNLYNKLSNGTYEIRVRATGNETNKVGTKILSQVAKAQLSLITAGSYAWQQPEAGYETLRLKYYIDGGGINKDLIIKIDTYDPITVNIGTSTYTGENFYTYNLPSNYSTWLTNGVHTIESYICLHDDNTTRTEVVKNEVFYKVGDVTTSNIVIQNLVNVIQPYVYTTPIFKYALLPTVDKDTYVELKIEFVKGDTILSKQELTNVKVGEKYDFNGQLEIDDSGIFPAYIRFYSKDDSNSNWKLLSTRTITVDASVSYGPVPLLSTDFHLNPKVRSNNETSKNVLYNAVNNNVVASSFENFGFINDGWVKDDNNISILRIPAGRKLTIRGYDVFSDFRPSKSTSNVTIDIDYKIRNIRSYQAESLPIIQIGTRDSNGVIHGYEKLPLKSYLCTSKNKTITVQDIQGIEDVRIHETINIVSNLAERGRNYVRFFQNNVIQREFLYEDGESFTANTETAKYITIGSEGADIDIYEIKVYKRQLSTTDIEQNYVASLPTIEEKKAYRAKNDIFESNLIKYNKVKANGINTLRWYVGTTTKEDVGGIPTKAIEVDEDHYIPSYSNQGSGVPKGTLEMIIYDKNKKPIAKYCQRLTNMKQKGQGTSSRTYWKWNVSWSPTDDTCRYVMDPNNENKWILDETVSGTDCYMIYPNGNSNRADIKAVKHVAKLNWASSMQTHKIGWCNMYTDLYWQVVGESATNKQSGYENTRKSTTQVPVLFFKGGATDPIFSSQMTFGPAKYDKYTFGLNAKSEHYNNKKWATCLEGSANGEPLPMRLIPWIKDEIFYYLNRNDDNDRLNETFVYKNSGNWAAQLDMDKAPTDVYNEGLKSEYEIPKGFSPVEGNSNLWQETIDTEFDSNDPTDTANFYKCNKGNTIKFFRRAYNNDYLHSPWVKCFNGTIDELKANKNLNNQYQYWIYAENDKAAKFDLYRWDYINSNWVNAGITKDSSTIDGYAKLNIYDQCNPWYNTKHGININKNGTIEDLTAQFIEARLYNYANGNTIGNSSNYYIEDDCLYDQAFRKIAALSDNWCKNTYERLDINGKITCDSDDNDTSGDLDNVGKSTKPYWVEEHDTYDSSTGHFSKEGDATYFNSETNVRYCLLEQARTVALRDKVQGILNAMLTLYGSSIAAMQKYFFDISDYFPSSSYNEQARLCYEDASVAMKNGKYSSDTDPLSQSLGDHYLAELQYWTKRMIYLSSYSRANDYTNAPYKGSFSFRIPKASLIKFTVTAAQAIYPVIRSEAVMNSERNRLLPGESCTISIQGAADKDIYLCYVDYYSNIGSLANIPVAATSKLTLNAKRLTTFNTDGSNKIFTPANIVFNTPILQNINLTNVTSLNGAVDLSSCIAITTINLMGSSNTSVVIPESYSLTNLHLGSNINELNLTNLPNLTTFEIDSIDKLHNLTLVGLQNEYNIFNNLYNKGLRNLTTVTITNINWKDVSLNILNILLNATTSNITGVMSIKDIINGNIKAKMLNVWGNVDDNNNSIYVIYTKVKTLSCEIEVPYRIRDLGVNNECKIISNGNDFSSVNWEIVNNETHGDWSEYCSINNKTGVITVSKLWEDDLKYSDTKIIIKCTLNNNYSGTGELVLFETSYYYLDQTYETGNQVIISGYVKERNDVIEWIRTNIHAYVTACNNNVLECHQLDDNTFEKYKNGSSSVEDIRSLSNDVMIKFPEFYYNITEVKTDVFRVDFSKTYKDNYTHITDNTFCSAFLALLSNNGVIIDGKYGSNTEIKDDNNYKLSSISTNGKNIPINCLNNTLYQNLVKRKGINYKPFHIRIMQTISLLIVGIYNSIDVNLIGGNNSIDRYRTGILDNIGTAYKNKPTTMYNKILGFELLYAPNISINTKGIGGITQSTKTYYQYTDLYDDSKIVISNNDIKHEYAIDIIKYMQVLDNMLIPKQSIKQDNNNNNRYWRNITSYYGIGLTYNQTRALFVLDNQNMYTYERTHFNRFLYIGNYKIID